MGRHALTSELDAAVIGGGESLPSREDVLISGLGLLTQNFSRSGASGTSIMVDGTVFVSAVGLLAGDVVTNLHTVTTTAGSGLTIAQTALLSSNGALLSNKIDSIAEWQATAGAKTHVLSSPYNITTTGVYYVAMFAKGSVLPTLLRGVGTAAAGLALGSGVRPFAGHASQTEIPATTSRNNTGVGYWVGVS